MVMRVKVEQILDQSEDKKEYFSSKYSIGKVGDLKVGKEIYCIPLGLEGGLYQVRRHRVEARGNKKGFKSQFSNWIKCKGYDDEGNKIEGATCCQLAQEQYDKYPEKNDSAKRLVKFSSTAVYIPVLVLGYSGLDKEALKIPVSKLTMKNYSFAYLDLSLNAYNQTLIAPLVEKLKNDGLIEYTLTGEELRCEVSEYLRKCLIKVTANQSKSPMIKYEKSYSFILFDNKNIGAETDQYKYITQYNKIQKVHNDIVDYLTLFDVEVNNLCADWTDDELIQYVNEGTRSQAIDTVVKEAKPSIPKEQQVVTMASEDLEIDDADDDVSFSEDSVDDFDSIDDTPSDSTATETVELDDGLLGIESDEEFLDEDTLV